MPNQPPTSRSAARLRGLRKRFDPITAVDGIDLDIRPGEFFSMPRPSGSGKTTRAARDRRLRVNGVPWAERKRRAADTLRSVLLADYGRRRPSPLSGGQRRRVALARPWSTGPRCCSARST
jgi:putative spermidine/putrescine transport system ATP-binding protein